MKKITFDYSNSQNFFDEKEFLKLSKEVEKIKNNLVEKKGLGNEFLGWINLPNSYNGEEIDRIKNIAKKIQNDSKVLVVIGIGGSYLGTKAAIDFLYDGFYNEFSKKNKTPEIYYAGNNLSSIYLKKIIDIIGDRDFSINVVSKSGNTIEPSIAFHIFKNKLCKKYGNNEASKRIYVISDKDSYLSSLGYETFYIPKDVGGRFSILSAVGLLPIAVSGGNIDLLLNGAIQARNYALNNEFENNDALKYALVRNILYRKGKIIEILASYEPSLNYVAEWWKQLYGESEGKEQKGIFPVSVNMTTDLHSLGQYIQDGKRIIFETLLNIENKKDNIELIDIDSNFDFLNDTNMNFVNDCAMHGSIEAHVSGGVPNLIINIPEQNEFYLGELLYFFEFAVGISGYLLGVNPFNQPGVENYKKNMYKLLGKNK